MKKYFDANQKRWNELADVHFTGDFYDVKKFREGGVSITDLERKEVGDVKGKELLHLQCHFGLDTLSWARRGATVTGLDFSEPAIAAAKTLAAETDLDARFLCGEISELSTRVDERFDIVFSV